MGSPVSCFPGTLDSSSARMATIESYGVWEAAAGLHGASYVDLWRPQWVWFDLPPRLSRCRTEKTHVGFPGSAGSIGHGSRVCRHLHPYPGPGPTFAHPPSARSLPFLHLPPKSLVPAGRHTFCRPHLSISFPAIWHFCDSQVQRKQHTAGWCSERSASHPPTCMQEWFHTALQLIPCDVGMLQVFYNDVHTNWNSLKCVYVSLRHPVCIWKWHLCFPVTSWNPSWCLRLLQSFLTIYRDQPLRKSLAWKVLRSYFEFEM